jgi:hypothetical protein
MTKLYGIFFLGALIVGCNDSSIHLPVLENDTAKVLQIALRNAFFERKLSESPALFRSNLFHDSILIDTDSFPKRLLPLTLDTLKFKFESYPQISGLLSNVADSLKPNYLYICCLERHDSVFSVLIMSRSTVNFGGGGGLYIEIVKRADSFIVKYTLGNSIN